MTVEPDLAQAGAAGTPGMAATSNRKQQTGGHPSGWPPALSCPCVNVGGRDLRCFCNRWMSESGETPERSRHCEQSDPIPVAHLIGTRHPGKEHQ